MTAFLTSEIAPVEAALQLMLAHEGIVRLFHFEPWAPSVGPYLIMEYVPWTTGDRWIAETGSEGLPAHVVIRVGLKLCEALAAAHEGRCGNALDRDPPGREEVRVAVGRLSRTGGRGIAGEVVARISRYHPPRSILDFLVGVHRRRDRARIVERPNLSEQTVHHPEPVEDVDRSERRLQLKS